MDAFANYKSTLSHIASLKAQVRELCDSKKILFELMTRERDRANKAEAELVALKKQIHISDLLVLGKVSRTDTRSMS